MPPVVTCSVHTVGGTSITLSSAPIAGTTSVLNTESRKATIA